jgi:two-component system, chemotaxis family, protein-glutamate methylesterase/glutaminase
MSVVDANAGVKVLVADDSAFMRTALTRMIESDPALRVVGTAQNGLEALDKVSKLQPDVITLDIEMPVLNGLETLKRIMQDSPRPVIMVSSLTQEGAEATLEALDLGAFDYLPKQLSYASLDIVKIKDDLVEKIKAACRFRRRDHHRRVAEPAPMTSVASAFRFAVPAIVALGTSTGGPKALQEILPALPQDLPVGIVIVQHMPPGFTGPFAKRLNNLSKVTVQEVQEGMLVRPGNVYIAEAGKHMTVYRRGGDVVLHVSITPSNSLHIPSVDVMMLSVAETFHSLAMGIIMTGMGADGALGMEAIFHEGGLTLGQDEASCAVYGMPRSCAEMGILKRVVPLTEIPRQILSAVSYRPH